MSVEGDLFHRARHLPFQGVGEASPSSGANPGPAPAPPTIPDHALRCRIGGGSYGEVWLARNVLGTLRAVKIVHRHSFEEKDAFNREFHGLQKFEPLSRTHEGLVDILQVGRTDEWLYYVMELADDGTVEVRTQNAEVKNDSAATNPQLSSASSCQTPYIPRTLRSDLNQRGRLPVEQCLEIGLKLTSALAHLHQHGLLHRDVKPSNIIFVDGQPKLADVGLVTEASDARSIVGTVGYIPIEGPGTPQADIFSLGKVLYEISTGRPRQDYPSLPDDLDELPDHERLVELNEVILNAGNDDHRLRYASADEMHQDLLLLQQGKSVRRSHALKRRLAAARKVIAGMAVLAMVAIGFQYVWNSRNPAQTSLSVLFKKLEANHGQPDVEMRLQTRIALALQRALVPENRFTDIADGPRLHFSPDGTQVLAIDEHPTAEVYDRQAGRFLFALEHDETLLFGGFSPDGTRLFTVTHDGEGHFWQAGSGQPIATHQFSDDFSDPEMRWRTLYSDPSTASDFTFTYGNGTLTIQADPGDAETWRRVALLPPQGDTVYSDVVVSIDILRWDTNLTDQTVALVARIQELRIGAPGYIANISLADTDYKGHSSVGIGRGLFPLKEEVWRPEPQKAYRLVFAVVGVDLHVSLLELDNLVEPLKSLSTHADRIWGSGLAAIWITTTSGHGTVKGVSAYDVTVDNYMVTGIVPEDPAPSE